MKKFIPDEPIATLVEQSGSGIRKKDENVMASMLLKLARAKLYIETGEIRNLNGDVVAESNVVKLINYVCRPESMVVGLPEFVGVLRELDLTELPNENVSQVVTVQEDSPRQRLLRRHSTSPPPRSHPASPLRQPRSSSAPPQEPGPSSIPQHQQIPDGRSVPLPSDSDDDEEEQDRMHWTSKRRWQSLDEPVGKRTRASKKRRTT